MSRILLIVSVLAVAGTAGSGPQLRKCVAPGGAVSYQDQPCAPDASEAWSQPVKALPSPVPAPAAAQAASSRPASPRASPAARLPAARPDPRRARCEQARREANEQRDRLWNKLSFAERSELDARVARACAREG